MEPTVKHFAGSRSPYCDKRFGNMVNVLDKTSAEKLYIIPPDGNKSTKAEIKYGDKFYINMTGGKVDSCGNVIQLRNSDKGQILKFVNAGEDADNTIIPNKSIFYIQSTTTDQKVGIQNNFGKYGDTWSFSGKPVTFNISKELPIA